MEELEQLFSEFDNSIQNLISKTWALKDSAEFFCALTDSSKVIAEQLTKLGDATFEVLTNEEEKTPEHRLRLLIGNYVWLPQMKSYLLLWRDTAFQVQKAVVLLWNEALSLQEFEEYKTKTKQQIEIASDKINNFIDKQVTVINAQKGGAAVQIDEWDLQDNPYSIYKNQIDQIVEQITKLEETFQIITNNYKTFTDIQTLIYSSLDEYQSIIKTQKSTANNTIDFIKDNISSKVGKVAIYTKNLETDIEYSNHQEAFKLAFETALLVLKDKFSVPIEIDNGIIQTQEINFRKRVKQWSEAEVLPLMYEVWEIMEFITDNLKMGLMNIQNRASVMANDVKIGKTDNNITEADAPLQTFLKKTEKWETELIELFGLIEDRLSQHFDISKIYDPKNEFLPVPLQSTLNQYWFAESSFYQRLERWYDIVNGKIQQFRSNVEQETTLSTSEKIVRYVQTHEVANEIHHYTSIFLTKGYIGEAFWIERKLEMQHVKELIGQWRLGYRGSLLLHGQRFSGKTLFGEMVANRYFSNNVVRLSPNNMIHFNGRKFHTTYDLGEAIEFVKKYNTNLQPLILIDDLEVWSSPENAITQNIRKLKKAIDNYSNNIFFMVSMSNWAKAHWNNIYEIDRVFQADFNLDKMNVKELQQAILIRHGATHRTLIDDNKDEIKLNQLRKNITKVSKAANGNIGEALNLWSISIKQVDEENVRFDYYQGYPMPDFINPDIGVVLSAVMMDKRTSEYRLSKLFGQAFQDKYKNIVQRLISVGLLLRYLDGHLEVNELVVNEVGRLLEREKYLRFSTSSN